ncbi:hypothetical protein [Nocardia africana]|uniref:Hydantoin racemase n=1 Tax=Nocardia africana TaxID=134964 RepID=A0ABW6NT89_9NOCA
MSEKMLGVLQLENEPVNIPGTFASPETFQFPVKRLTVPGAWARKLVDGDLSLKDSYISCARQLESEGVAAITTNCGMSALFQEDIAAAVSIPVAVSSLLMVPVVARTMPKGRKVGVLTYDADKLTERHFVGAGWSPENFPVAIAGIEGSESWRRLADPAPAVTPDLLIGDVLVAVKTLLQRAPSVGALVFECTGFPVASETVRRETGLLVADSVSLAKSLVEMSPRRVLDRG